MADASGRRGRTEDHGDAPDESRADAPDESRADAPDESRADAPDESRADAPDERDDDPRPNDGWWASLYARLHRSVPYSAAVFGVLTAVGVLAIGRSVTTLVAEALNVSVVTILLGVCGSLLFALGVGYFVVRHDASCEECGADFAKEAVGKTYARRDADGRTRPVDVLECGECGHRTTVARSSHERDPPTW